MSTAKAPAAPSDRICEKPPSHEITAILLHILAKLAGSPEISCDVVCFSSDLTVKDMKNF